MPSKQSSTRPNSLKAPAKVNQSTIRFESGRIEKFFEVLDAVAWLDAPTTSQVAQFAGIDPRTAGKLLKNGLLIGLVDISPSQHYHLARPYPHKGTDEQKRVVVQEGLIRMPLLVSMRQFMRLGANISDALRKAAVVQKIPNFDASALAPLIAWAQQLQALDAKIDAEDLILRTEEAKEDRHRRDSKRRVVFLSHSSKDKPFIRQLATDLGAEGISVWLDEQDIKVGDSIPERIAQGVADSDYFIIALSENSINSSWVKKELNSALISEINRRGTKILPLLLSDVEIPLSISDKKYANFAISYKGGLQELLHAIRTDM